jgi:hypothetical protein
LPQENSVTTAPYLHSLPRPSAADRVATDLRALADAAAWDDRLALAIAHAVKQLHITLPHDSQLSLDTLGAAVVAFADAAPVPQELVEPKWATQAWALPAGVIRLTATQLTRP